MFSKSYFLHPFCFKDIVLPEERKLPQLETTPEMWDNIAPMKIPKRRQFMRGPETVHNRFLYNQYGIIVRFQINFFLQSNLFSLF